MKLNKQLIIGFSLSLSVLSCGVAREAIDCGSGDSISIESNQYCVYELAVVVENGFNCPAELSALSQDSELGVCANVPIDDREFDDVREKFEEEFPEKVKKKQEDNTGEVCTTLSDCNGAPCTNGFCEALNNVNNTNNANSCESDGDCDGKACIDGVCTLK